MGTTPGTKDATGCNAKRTPAVRGYSHGPNLQAEIRTQVHKLLADALRDQQAVVLCGPCPKAKWEVEIVWTTGD
jgi:hypothetical protein